MLPDGNVLVGDNISCHVLQLDHGTVSISAGYQVAHTPPKLLPFALGRPRNPAEGFDDGLAAVAKFGGDFQQLAAAPDGSVYVAERKRLRLIKDGRVSTVVASSGGHNDGPLETAEFHDIYGVAVDFQGVVYVSDHWNHCIRKIENGDVTTFAGAPYIVSGGGYPQCCDGSTSEVRSKFFCASYMIALNIPLFVVCAGAVLLPQKHCRRLLWNALCRGGRECTCSND